MLNLKTFAKDLSKFHFQQQIFSAESARIILESWIFFGKQPLSKSLWNEYSI